MESGSKIWVGAALFGVGAASIVWFLHTRKPAARFKVAASTLPPPAAATAAGRSSAQVLAQTAPFEFPLSLRELESDSDAVPDGVELKMVIAVRSDLGMSKGKTAAQVGHAVLGCWLEAQTSEKWRQWCKAWYFRAAAKIALKVEDEAELDRVAAAAAKAGLPFIVIEDAGRTEIPAGSRTVCGIGPAPKGEIDKITGPKGAIPLRLLN